MRWPAQLRERVAAWARHHPRVKHPLVAAQRTVDRWKHRVARHCPAVIRPRPGNLTVAITARCNLRCEGCLYERGFMPGEVLPWPIARDLLTDAARAGFRSVRLYGGEPLLHPDLPRMGRLCRELGLPAYVTTNATLLGRRIDELHDSGLRDYTIGMYGSGEDYDRYVGRPGMHDRAVASLRAVRSRYGSRVGLRLNWLLMRPTCDVAALDTVWELARELDAPIQVDLIHYSLPYFTEGEGRRLQFGPGDRDRIRVVVDRLLELRARRPDLLHHSEEGLRSIPDWLLLGPRMRVPCDKYDMIWVGADGSVQLCYVTFPLGNLHDQRLGDILHTDAHRSAARSAFALDCPNCHCGYDTRVQKHAPTRSRVLRSAESPTMTTPCA